MNKLLLLCEFAVSPPPAFITVLPVCSIIVVDLPIILVIGVISLLLPVTIHGCLLEPLDLVRISPKLVPVEAIHVSVDTLAPEKLVLLLICAEDTRPHRKSRDSRNTTNTWESVGDEMASA